MDGQATGDSRPGRTPGRDPSLRRPPGLPAGFDHGGTWATAVPSAALAVALETAAGPQDLYLGAETDALVGIARQSDLPDGWDDSLTYEISGALAMGPVSAGNLAHLAWTLGTRLAGTGRLLAAGILTLPKA